MFRSITSVGRTTVNLAKRHFCDDLPTRRVEKSINEVRLLGRVGAEPKMVASEKASGVTFNMATSINWRTAEGELKQKTEWHKIAVFRNGLRESVITNVKKGSRLLVTGKLSYNSVQDANGSTQNYTSIIADDVVYLSSRNQAADETDAVPETGMFEDDQEVKVIN